ncbi:MAG: autotransporter domain-containing protein [Candidatus Brevundimonas phytovorans]|nr:autotransporter domain-containing protein [Brevundimonas sp.]WEK58383.1 MAG: autotransporter domain-containing protein [Brevundimonas sp.]
MPPLSHLSTTTNSETAPCKTLSLRSRLQIGSALVGAAMALTSPVMASTPPHCGLADRVVTCSGFHPGTIDYVNGADPVTLNIAADAAIETSLDNAGGLHVSTQNGEVSVNQNGDIVTSGVRANGIFLAGLGGAISVTNNGSLTTYGELARGIATARLGDHTVINTGDITTNGAQSEAVNVLAESGAVRILNAAGSSITTHGDNSSGVWSVGLRGDILIENYGDILTSGRASHGIAAIVYERDLSAIIGGSVQTAGAGAAGVSLQNYVGDITAVIGSVSVAGQGSVAVGVNTFSAGKVDLSTSGTISAALGSGTRAVSNLGSVTLRNSADVVAQDLGLQVYAANVANIANSGQISTTAASAHAIEGRNLSGALTILNTGSAATTGLYAIGLKAETESGTIVIDNQGLVSTTADLANGVQAVSIDGALDLTNSASGQIITLGDQAYGLNAQSQSGAIAIDNRGVITADGYAARGISVSTGSDQFAAAHGDVTLTNRGQISTTGDQAYGILARATRGDIIADLSAVATAGTYSDALNILTSSGDIVLDLSGQISTQGTDSQVVEASTTSGKIDIRNAATLTTTGDVSAGLSIHALTGTIKIVSTGAISTAGLESAGVVATTMGDVSITADRVTTTGDRSTGIRAEGINGVVINANAISTTGQGGLGVYSRSETGDVSVTARTVHADNLAIFATSTAGDIAVVTRGEVTSARAGAIYAVTDGAVRLDIEAASVLTSGAPSVNSTAFSASPASVGVSTVIAQGATVTINNAGTINQGGRSTISARGEVMLSNSGLITGNVDFSGGDAIINNTGRFALSGVSNFGGGADRFVNTGLVTTQGRATLAGLERFVNAGAIDLGNGRADDVLTISGDYEGQGGRLVLDVDAGAAGGAAYDQLVVGGSATGTTTISLNYKTAARLAPGEVLKLVDAAGGSASGAFVMAPGATNIGFSRYGLGHDAVADDFFIAVTEGDAVFRSLKLSEGAQSLWRQSAEAWSAHTAALRDPTEGAPASGRVWGQIYGAVDKRDETLNRADQAVDLSYTQDHVGGQMGFDMGRLGETGMTYGLTGGYVSSTLEFRDKADRADYKGLNVGLYAGAQRGRVFVNALAKYDLIDIQARSATAGYDEDLDGHGYGLQVETGARFNRQFQTRSFFFEPLVSLAYSRTDLDNLSAQGAVIDFEALDGLRARAGARLGGAAALAQGQLAYYLGAHLVQELAGEDGVRFISGAAAKAFDNTAVDAYGQYQLGVTFTSNSGLSGFVEARADAGDNYRTYTGRIGVRVSF